MKARGFGGLLDAMGGNSKEVRDKHYNGNCTCCNHASATIWNLLATSGGMLVKRPVSYETNAQSVLALAIRAPSLARETSYRRNEVARPMEATQVAISSSSPATAGMRYSISWRRTTKPAPIFR